MRPSRAFTFSAPRRKIHREHKLKKGKEEIIKLSVESIQQARQYTEDVEFSPEDASRTELEFLEEITQAAVEAGATTINLPDTVGYATPKAYGEIFSHLLAKLPILRETKHHPLLPLPRRSGPGGGQFTGGRGKRRAAGRVHDQRHRRAGRQRGAGRDRHGAAHAQRLLQDRHATSTPRKIYPASRMVSTLTGLAVQRNKAIVGENAFAHEAGIHQDGVLKYRETYEIMDPATVGIPKSRWCWASTAAGTRSRIASCSWATR